MRIIFSLLFCVSFYLNVRAQTSLAPVVGISQHYNDIVVGANAEFMIYEETVSLSPDVIVYMPLTEGGYKKNWVEFNFNGHYYFFNHNHYQFYGIGGLNYTGSRYKYKVNGEVSKSNTINANMGGGLNFRIGQNFTPFSEIKYVVGKSNLVILAGIKFSL